jgi:hypothetical protein
MEKVGRVLELADGALVSGETSYDRARIDAVSLPLPPAPEPVLPRPATIEPEDRDQWSRSRRQSSTGLYHPPGPPNEPL